MDKLTLVSLAADDPRTMLCITVTGGNKYLYHAQCLLGIADEFERNKYNSQILDNVVIFDINTLLHWQACNRITCPYTEEPP